MAELVRQTPLGGSGRPEEVAAVVTFMLSADAGFLTRIDVLVDGGVCIPATPGSSPAGRLVP